MKRSVLLHSAMLSPALLLVAACSDDGTAVIPCEPTTTSVDVEVSTGSEVTFDWSPACDVSLILIEPEASGSDVWGLHTEDRNGIAPPVRFGETRTGAETVSGSGTLTPGSGYEVILWRVTSEGERLMAVHPFTR